MKDYRIRKEQDPHYIIKAKPIATTTQGQPEKFQVRFGDGKVFKNLVVDEENMEKVIAKQEEQAKLGVKNLPLFEKKKTNALYMSGAAMVGGPIIARAIESIVSTGDDPLSFAIKTGAITVAALIPGVYSLVKNAPIVKELRKVKYRDDHRNDLNSFSQYENALTGVPAKTARALINRYENGDDPYCITYVDTYTQQDLETIVANIDREKEFQFTYAPKKTVQAKK